MAMADTFQGEEGLEEGVREEEEIDDGWPRRICSWLPLASCYKCGDVIRSISNDEERFLGE